MRKKQFINKNGGSKVVGNISDRALCNAFDIPINTLRSWKTNRSKLYWFLKKFDKNEIEQIIKESKSIETSD